MSRRLLTHKRTYKQRARDADEEGERGGAGGLQVQRGAPRHRPRGALAACVVSIG